MRPPGEIRQVLLAAVSELATSERGVTLRELAAHAKVGTDSAKMTLSHMRRADQVRVLRTRRVPYRNRPVAEYVPATSAAPESTGGALTDAVRSFWGPAPTTLASI